MFYCELCRAAKGWPRSLTVSIGNCEVCGERELCHDVSSEELPLAKEERMKAGVRAMREGNLHTVASAVGDYMCKEGDLECALDHYPHDFNKMVYKGLKEILDRMGLELRVKEG